MLELHYSTFGQGPGPSWKLLGFLSWSTCKWQVTSEKCFLGIDDWALSQDLFPKCGPCNRDSLIARLGKVLLFLGFHRTQEIPLAPPSLPLLHSFFFSLAHENNNFACPPDHVYLSFLFIRNVSGPRQKEIEMKGSRCWLNCIDLLEILNYQQNKIDLFSPPALQLVDKNTNLFKNFHILRFNF